MQQILSLFRGRRYAPGKMLQRSRALSSAEIEILRGALAGIGPLQRSRALSSAEMKSPSVAPRCRPRFNGAALFRARRSALALAIYFADTRLQRSRALSSAEMRGGKALSADRNAASTEPRSFERGDRSRQDDRACMFPGFNGAALFRARRWRDKLTAIPKHPSFNGAALFRARRSIAASRSSS